MSGEIPPSVSQSGGVSGSQGLPESSHASGRAELKIGTPDQEHGLKIVNLTGKNSEGVATLHSQQGTAAVIQNPHATPQTALAAGHLPGSSTVITEHSMTHGTLKNEATTRVNTPIVQGALFAVGETSIRVREKIEGTPLSMASISEESSEITTQDELDLGLDDFVSLDADPDIQENLADFLVSADTGHNRSPSLQNPAASESLAHQSEAAKSTGIPHESSGPLPTATSPYANVTYKKMTHEGTTGHFVKLGDSHTIDLSKLAKQNEHTYVNLEVKNLNVEIKFFPKSKIIVMPAEYMSSPSIQREILNAARRNHDGPLDSVMIIGLSANAWKQFNSDLILAFSRIYKESSRARPEENKKSETREHSKLTTQVPHASRKKENLDDSTKVVPDNSTADEAKKDELKKMDELADSSATKQKNEKLKDEKIMEKRESQIKKDETSFDSKASDQRRL